MSLDLWMTCNACRQDGGNFNYTYNCSPMWYAARPQDKEMIPIEGMTGKESLPILLDGYAALTGNRETMLKLNPANGWGDYDSFCKFVLDLIGCAKNNPEMKWSCSR